MQLLRVLGGVLAAAVVGVIIGATRDYLVLKGVFADEPAGLAWPVVSGVSAALGAIVMALIKPGSVAAGGSVRSGTQLSTARAAQTARTKTAESLPEFDLDKARATSSAIEGAEQALQPGSAPEGEQQ